MAPRLRILVDASPLCDGRRTAGIGRYVAGMTGALAAEPGLVVRCVIPGGPPRRDSRAVRWLHAQPGLLRHAVGMRPHLVHGMASDPVLVWPARRQVVTVHDVIPWTYDPPPAGSPTARYQALQGRRLRRCAAIVAVSDAVAAEATRTLRLDPRRVHVVAEGTDAVFTDAAGDDDDALRRSAGVGDEAYVLWVGSMRSHDRRKALDTLLDAVAAAGEDQAPPPLVMAGATGDESGRIAALAASRGLRLTLPGFVDDRVLAALYRGASAVAVPSIMEGFGLPLLEALACGAPVVATDDPSLVALAGDAALTVPAADTRSLAQALRRLIGDATLRRRLAEAGPRRAAPYTWQRAAERTAAVYRTALGR